MLERAGEELPGEADRLALEVVAEAEVAEHLEERVVARGVADVLEVVVLAAGAHAALRARGARVGALLRAEEDVLELDHAGVGEQQRRVVARHQRARGHDGVAVALEESRNAARSSALLIWRCAVGCMWSWFDVVAGAERGPDLLGGKARDIAGMRRLSCTLAEVGGSGRAEALAAGLAGDGRPVLAGRGEGLVDVASATPRSRRSSRMRTGP